MKTLMIVLAIMCIMIVSKFLEIGEYLSAGLFSVILFLLLHTVADESGLLTRVILFLYGNRNHRDLSIMQENELYEGYDDEVYKAKA